MTKLAIIGLGQLGAPVAANLSRVHSVTAFDTVPHASVVKSLEGLGVQIADSPAAAVHQAEVVITVLPTSEIVESVITDRSLLANVVAGALFIDLTSGNPTHTRRLAKAMTKLDFRMVDAPICNGGVLGAQNGNLTIALGGAQKDKELSRDVLSSAVSTFLDAGAIGNGHVLKLASNLIANAISPLVAEAFAIGQAAGVDRETLHELLPSCAANNWIDLAQVIPEPTSVTGGGEGSFKADLAAKDLRYASDLAGAHMIPHLISDAIKSTYIRTSQQGFGHLEARLAPWALNSL